MITLPPVFHLFFPINKVWTNANSNSIVQLPIQIKNGIIKHANVRVKIIVHAKNIILGILAHVCMRMVSI